MDAEWEPVLGTPMRPAVPLGNVLEVQFSPSLPSSSPPRVSTSGVPEDTSVKSQDQILCLTFCVITWLLRAAREAQKTTWQEDCHDLYQSETSFNLISEKCDILSILRDHPENRIYQRKIQELSKRFTAIRKTKGDGNCFYRALGYSYLESLLGKSREILKFKERVLQTPNDLLAAGFEEHKFQNFFNAFYSVVELVEKDSSVSSLLKVFNDQSSSDHIVQFLRLLTSAFIKNRADFFRHFIDEEMDIKDFCTHEVEPMAMECDHIQITALSQALNIALQVEYVDEMDTALNHHVFPEAAIPSVYLLYKTSHYNILYAADKH